MNTMLKRSKVVIRTFIRLHWDDAKLAEVYAFNQDGHMRYANTCGCILGVTTRTVHVGFCTESLPNGGSWVHYDEARELSGAMEAESAYARLGGIHNPTEEHGSDYFARVRLSAILRAEMRRRERDRAQYRAAQLKAMVEECSHA